MHILQIHRLFATGVIVALIQIAAATLCAQSEFVRSKQDAVEFRATYGSNYQVSGPSLTAAASIKGWADLGLAVGYFTRNHVSVTALALHGDLLFVKQARESAPFSLALVGSAEVEAIKVTHGYPSGSTTATLATAGVAAFRCFQLGQNVRMVSAIEARRVISIDPSGSSLFSGGGSIMFAIDGGERTSIIVGVGVNIVEDVATISLSMGTLISARR